MNTVILLLAWLVLSNKIYSVLIYIDFYIDFFFILFVHYWICRKRPSRTSIQGLPWWWNLGNMFLDTDRPWKLSDKAKPRWSSLPTTLLPSGKVFSLDTRCNCKVDSNFFIFIIVGFGVWKMKMKSNMCNWFSPVWKGRTFWSKFVCCHVQESEEMSK